MRRRPAAAAPKTGGPAPSFSLPDLFDRNRIHSSENFLGSVLLVNLWASWCPPCRKEMPLFFRLQDVFGRRGFRLAAVNLDSGREKALSFLRDVERREGRKVPFTVLYDGKKSLARKYGPVGLPASYLVDRGGRLVKAFHGSFDERTIIVLRRAVEAVLESGE